MTIIVPSTPAASEKALASLAAAVGRPLPQSYLNFASRHDGAEPEHNSFKIDSANESGVRRFIPAAEAAAILGEIDGFPRGAIALAEDDCGNYVYLDPAGESVCFWDHEWEGGVRLAGDVSAFLELLTPFDLNSAQSTSANARIAWVNPSFKPEF